MRGSHSRRTGVPPSLLAGIAALTFCLAVQGQDLPGDHETAPNLEPGESATEALPGASLHPLTLRECISIALNQQPSIHAARASLAAAQDRSSSVQNLRVPGFLARDLPIRRQQAASAIDSAAAGLARSESDTIYAVTYSYLTILYATEQLQLSKNIEQNLTDLDELVRSMRKNKQRRADVWDEHHNLVQSYLNTTRGRRQVAIFGRKRAMAALREAMGLPPGCDLVLVPTMLPCPTAAPCLADIVALAVARRGELVQAQVAASVSQLEIAAQGALCRSTARTYAAGSDIHSGQVPPGDLGTLRYEPRALLPEMPTTLVGSRGDRQKQAADYAMRAGAVLTKTQGLVALEAEDAFYVWQEKQLQAKEALEAYRNAKIFSDKLREDFNREEAGSYPYLDILLLAGINTTRSHLEYKQSHYQYLLALAALQRITSGGFCVDFDTAPACPEEPDQITPKKVNGKGHNGLTSP